ncbi:MAG: cyclic nucleotide-binding domain-containing protein [Pseudomonadota bacterium]
MSLDEEVTLLKSVPLFKGIAPGKLKLLAFISDRVRFSSGEALMEQGAEGDAAFVIIDGTADVVIGGDGDRRVVATLGRNDIVGEIAIIADIPRTATVVARNDIEALMISKANFLKLLREVPEIALEVLRVVGLRLDATLRDMSALRAATKSGG